MKLADFTMARQTDVTIGIGIEPPVPVGGWEVQFQVTNRFGGSSGLITKSVASGFNGVSGVSVVNSGQGIFNVAIGASDTSGRPYGNYSYEFNRLSSGNMVRLVEGFLSLTP